MTTPKTSVPRVSIVPGGLPLDLAAQIAGRARWLRQEVLTLDAYPAS